MKSEGWKQYSKLNLAAVELEEMGEGHEKLYSSESYQDTGGLEPP